MLNPGKKIHALRDKKINILTLVLSEIKILNETKNHNSLQVKWSVPKYIYVNRKLQKGGGDNSVPRAPLHVVWISCLC
jgi:hypothetical protein